MVSPLSQGDRIPPPLPAKFQEMNAHDKARALQSWILSYIEVFGQVTPGEISQALPEVTPDSIKRQLRALSTSQSIYEVHIGNVPIYYKNGLLAHPSLQRFLSCGRTAYSFRTYSDRQAGQAVTITEYQVSPMGNRRPKSGLRIDLADLESFLTVLTDIRDLIKKDPNKLAGNLR